MNFLSHATILAIDDDNNILSLLQSILANKCKELILRNNDAHFLEIICKKQPNLILLDVMIGKTTGYKICKALKANIETQHIPVIFLSSLTLPEDKVKGFEAGGVDFISKPFNFAEILARIESCLATHQKIQQQAQEHLEKTKQILENFRFSKHEMEILTLYISGHKRSDIATKTCVSENTIKWHLKKFFKILNVTSRAALIEKIRSLELMNV